MNLISVVERFLVEYLQVWNGTDFFIEILRLLNFIRITDFDGEKIFNKEGGNSQNFFRRILKILLL